MCSVWQYKITVARKVGIYEPVGKNGSGFRVRILRGAWFMQELHISDCCIEVEGRRGIEGAISHGNVLMTMMNAAKNGELSKIIHKLLARVVAVRLLSQEKRISFLQFSMACIFLYVH